MTMVASGIEAGQIPQAGFDGAERTDVNLNVSTELISGHTALQAYFGDGVVVGSYMPMHHEYRTPEGRLVPEAGEVRIDCELIRANGTERRSLIVNERLRPLPEHVLAFMGSLADDNKRWGYVGRWTRDF